MQSQLASERMTVVQDASMLAGQPVAFGVAFMAFGLGIVRTLVGVAPRRAART